MRKPIRTFRRDMGGTAAVEFALIAGTLIFVLLNAVDLARYYVLRSAVETATQMAVQAAWKTCDSSHVPATVNCTGLTGAVTASLQASQLGSGLTLASGSPSEAYYCVSSTGALTQVAAINAVKPSDCSSAAVASGKPADYLKVQASYSYSPLFPGTVVAGMLPTPLTASAVMRLQ